MATRGAPVPTTVVTGWLGVGKTTALLHAFASKPAHERWAVLVNEVGEVGIDGALLGAGGVSVREIPGGCICCTSGPQLQVSLGRLLSEVKPDRLFIEPTGIAAPSAILDTLRLPWFRDAVDRRAVITLVDARRLDVPLELQPAAWREQVEVADVLVANKADLASAEELARFTAFASSLWPPKSVVAAISHGAMDPAWFDLAPPATTSRFRPVPVVPVSHDLPEGQGWIWPPGVVFDLPRLRDTLAELAGDHPALPGGLVRIKGIFHTSSAWVLVQGDADRLAFSPVAHRADSRVELLVPASPLPDWPAVEAALSAAISAGA